MVRTVIEFISGLNDGGAETLVKDYALLIDRNLFKVIVVVIRETPYASNFRILRENGVEIIPIYIKWNKFIRIIHKLFGNFIVPIRLKNIVKIEQPQAIHIHLSLLGYVRYAAKKLVGIKLLYTCHSVLSVYFSGKNKKQIKSAEYLIKYNGLQMIALHDSMAKEINQLFSIDNTVVIRNGIDFKRFQIDGMDKVGLRKDLNIPEKAFVVGHIGRFVKQKNHRFLIEIFKEIRREKKNSYLLLIGDGKLKEEIDDLIDIVGLSDKVQILSNRSDIPRLMAIMDVFVFPSLNEGLGIVAIEAQVSHLRCIMSDTIPKDAFITEDAIPMPLEKPAEWAKVILDTSIKSKGSGNLADWDMNNEIKRLENLYLDKMISL